ncbi:MAG: DUF3810 domain-containing protein [Saprospiraceae bacterium]|nr:DUF3810 domain-containing protein [Saprospiraceae bacterium]
MRKKSTIRFAGRALDTRWLWVALAILAITLRVLFSYSPQLCETLYSRGLFLGIRLVIDYTLGYLPFATIYLLFAYLVYKFLYGIWGIGRYIYLKSKGAIEWGIIKFIIDQVFSLVAFLCMFIFLFFFMWAYNYQRVPLEQQLKLKAAPMTTEEIEKEAIWIMNKCANLRATIPNADTSALDQSFFPKDVEGAMRELLVKSLEDNNYPTVGCVRGRFLYPKGVLLGFQASGIYMPFTGEGHIDAGLHILQKPFTTAHELAHGYGFGDEAVCNFWGFVACVTAEDPAIQYVGYLTYWRYVFSELRRMDKDLYKKIRATIPLTVDKDLDAIYTNNDQYPDFFNTAQVYNAYLKTQGVQEGIRSYNRMVLLVAEWRHRLKN